MGELFANFERYDVQETRRAARAEGIKKLIIVMRNLGLSQELAAKQLAEQYDLPEAEALEKVKLYW